MLVLTTTWRLICGVAYAARTTSTVDAVAAKLALVAGLARAVVAEWG